MKRCSNSCTWIGVRIHHFQWWLLIHTHYLTSVTDARMASLLINTLFFNYIDTVLRQWHSQQQQQQQQYRYTTSQHQTQSLHQFLGCQFSEAHHPLLFAVYSHPRPLQALPRKISFKKNVRFHNVSGKFLLFLFFVCMYIRTYIKYFVYFYRWIK